MFWHCMASQYLQIPQKPYSSRKKPYISVGNPYWLCLRHHPQNSLQQWHCSLSLYNKPAYGHSGYCFILPQQPSWQKKRTAENQIKQAKLFNKVFTYKHQVFNTVNTAKVVMLNSTNYQQTFKKKIMSVFPLWKRIFTTFQQINRLYYYC